MKGTTMSGFSDNLSNYPPGVTGNEPEITGEPRRSGNTRTYVCHWSDNQNQLGEPSSAAKGTTWELPWVYLHSRSLKDAKDRVREFNALLRPSDFPQPAHCPTALLAKYGFITYPAGPLIGVDPMYLAD